MTRFWIRGAEGDLGPYDSPQAAGEAWPQVKGLDGPVLVADYEDGLGVVTARPKDVDACLVALLRARTRTRKGS